MGSKQEKPMTKLIFNGRHNGKFGIHDRDPFYLQRIHFQHIVFLQKYPREWSKIPQRSTLKPHNQDKCRMIKLRNHTQRLVKDWQEEIIDRICNHVADWTKKQTSYISKTPNLRSAKNFQTRSEINSLSTSTNLITYQPTLHAKESFSIENNPSFQYIPLSTNSSRREEIPIRFHSFFFLLRILLFLDCSLHELFD